MWLNLRVISLTCHLHETVDAIQKLFSRSLSNAITRKWLVHLCEGLWNSSYLKRSAFRRQWHLALQCFFKFLKPYPRRSRFPKVWLKNVGLGQQNWCQANVIRLHGHYSLKFTISKISILSWSLFLSLRDWSSALRVISVWATMHSDFK